VRDRERVEWVRDRERVEWVRGRERVARALAEWAARAAAWETRALLER
jgi:hypothetical protein